MNENFLPKRINIYPSEFSLRTGIRQEAGKRGRVISGYANIEYSNFLNEIFKYSLKPNKGLLSETARFLAVKKICDDICKMDCGTSFIGLIDKIITELRESGISSVDFTEACKRTDREDSLHIIIEAFKRYEELLLKKPTETSGGFYDLADKKRLIAEFFENPSPSAIPDILLNVSEIVFQNIYSTTELDFRIIKALSVFMGRKNGRVIFKLPYDSNRQDAFRFMEQRIESFEKLGDRYPYLELEFDDIVDFNESETKRGFILKNIFRSYTEDAFFSGKGDGAIRKEIEEDTSAEIFRALDPEDELDSVFRKIRMLLEQGADVEKIAVISSGIFSMRDKIKYFSRLYSVPVIFSKGLPLNESSVSSFLMILFRMINDKMSFELLNSLILSPFADPISLVKANHDILYENGFDDLADYNLSENLSNNVVFNISKRAYLDNLSDSKLINRIKEYYEEISERINVIMPEGGQDNEIELNESVSMLPQIKLLLATSIIIYEKLKIFRQEASKGVPDVGRFIKAFVAQFGIKNKIFSSSVSSSPDSLSFISDEEAAIKKFTSLAISIAGGFKLSNFNFSNKLFFELLNDSIKKTYLSSGSQNNGVCFLEPEDAVGREFENVFICGINEGSFPAFITENPYFSDSDKKLIAGALRKIDREHMDESTEKLYEESSKLTQKITDSRLENIGKLYRRALEEQVTSSPFTTSKMLYWKQSFLFLSCIKSATEKIYFSFYSKSASGVRVPPSYYMDQVFSFLNETPESCEIKPDGRIFSKQDLFKFFSDSSVRDSIKKHYRDIFDDFSIVERNSKFCPVNDITPLGQKDCYSPTELEKYISCPFKYFIENVLKIQNDREFALDVDYDIRGKLIHTILKKYFSIKKPNDSFDNEILKKSIDDSFEEFSKKYDICHKALIKKNKDNFFDMIKKWIVSDFERSKMFSTSILEKKLSISEYLNVNGKSRKINFTGRADRIDVDPDSGKCEIIDYKTGNCKQNQKLEFKDKKPRFQPKIYVDAVEKTFKDFNDVLFKYAYIKDGKSMGALTDVMDDLIFAIEGIETGRFDPADVEIANGICKRCNFGIICGYKEDSERDGD